MTAAASSRAPSNQTRQASAEPGPRTPTESQTSSAPSGHLFRNVSVTENGTVGRLVDHIGVVRVGGIFGERNLVGILSDAVPTSFVRVIRGWSLWFSLLMLPVLLH